MLIRSNSSCGTSQQSRGIINTPSGRDTAKAVMKKLVPRAA
jgi:hypothetical protein